MGLLRDMQHIHHFPEWENWLIQGYLLGKSEKAKHLQAQRTADVTLPTLAGLLRGAERPCAHTRCSDSHTNPAPLTSLVTLSYLSGNKLYRNVFLPQRGTWGWTGASRSTRKKWGCTSQCSQPDPSHTAQQGLVVVSCLKTSQCKPQQCWLRTESCQSHPWLLELELLSNFRAQGPPTLLPAHLFCKDYFKLTDKEASVF